MTGFRLLLPAILIIAALAACTKTVRMVELREYDTALADTTRMFEIHTRDGAQFVSKKGHVEGDTVLVVTKGYQVQTDPWRQKALANVPIYIPMASVEQISQIDIDQDTSLGVVLVILAVVLAAAFAIGWASGLGGP